MLPISTLIPLASWLNKQFIPNSISALVEEGLEMEQLQKYSYFKGKVPGKDTEKVSVLICMSKFYLFCAYLFSRKS